jgi:hypothetical protein
MPHITFNMKGQNKISNKSKTHGNLNCSSGEIYNIYKRLKYDLFIFLCKYLSYMLKLIYAKTPLNL